MKKLIFSMVTFIALTITINAQKVLDKGYIKMEISEVNSDNEQMKMMADMMKGTQMEVMFNEKINKTSMSMMGGMMNTTTFTGVGDGDQEINMLMDMMGQKFWITTTQEESMQNEQAKAAAEAKIEYDKSDTKEILGYKAYKVKVTMPGESTPIATGYITEDIKANANGIQGMQGMQINGFPLEVTIFTPEFSMTMNTIEIKDKVDESALVINGEGYKKMSMEEFQKQMGGVGMGF